MAAERLEPRVLFAATNDPRAASQWALASAGLDRAWDATRGSATVIAATIDTGADYTHQDLYANVWINQAEIPAALNGKIHDTDRDGRVSFYDLNAPGNAGFVKDNNSNGYIDAGDLLRPDAQGGWEDGLNGRNNANDAYTDDIVGWDFAENDNKPLDDGYTNGGHGTHVAGIMGAVGNNGVGVSGASQKLSMAILRVFGDGGYVPSYSTLAAAIRYGADIGARVANASWGGSTGSNGDGVYQAIAYAGSRGQTFFAAAGNSGSNLDGSSSFYPAEYDLENIVVVGATGTNGSAPYWSNFGATKVDVSAPGNGIMSTLPGNRYGQMSGTSMAAPLVTGAAALMIAANPALTPSLIKARLIAGSDEFKSLNARSVSHGQVNIANAMAGREGWNLGTSGATSNGSGGARSTPASKIGLMSLPEGTYTGAVAANPFGGSTIGGTSKDLLA
jgi:serine protease